MNPAVSRTRTFPARVVVSLVMLSALVLGAERAEAKYRGFTIDGAKLTAAVDQGALARATEEQIDMICDAGFSGEATKFLQGVLFELVPAGTIPRGSPGLYNGRDRSVKVTSNLLNVGHKPVLLHELMHAFHDRMMKDGFNNSDINRFFVQARGDVLFEAKSPMMQNKGEFFACAATTYLFGVTGQEPFNREKLKERQPALFEYLARLFGPRASSCKGSLARQTSAEEPAANKTDARKADPVVQLEPLVVAENSQLSFGVALQIARGQPGNHVLWMIVERVADGSDAQRQGLTAGSRVVSIDGQSVTDYEGSFRKGSDLNRIFIGRPRGARVTLEVIPFGTTKQEKFTIVHGQIFFFERAGTAGRPNN